MRLINLWVFSEDELEATHRGTREVREHASRLKVDMSCNEVVKLIEESAPYIQGESASSSSKMAGPLVASPEDDLVTLEPTPEQRREIEKSASKFSTTTPQALSSTYAESWDGSDFKPESDGMAM